MRSKAILWLLVLAASIAYGQTPTPSRIDLSIEERLDTPQKIAGGAVTLRDFVGVIGNSFKVPLLVEIISPVPDLTIPAGTYSARQLLDSAVQQLHGYQWNDERGVAHLYELELARAKGNLLNVTIHSFSFPKSVADFILLFRACINSTIQGYGCLGGVIDEIVPASLDKEPLSHAQFEDVAARSILLKALQANGRFYVLIAYDSTRPRLISDFSFINWFTQSVVPAKPSPMWIQRPPQSHRSR